MPSRTAALLGAAAPGAGRRRDDELSDRPALQQLIAAAPELRPELRDRARASGLLIAWVTLLVVPAWWVVERLLAPGQAATFLTIRLLCELPIALATWALWRGALGRRRPEWLTFAVLAVVQSEIAWMVPRAPDAHYYLLGLTLAIYASGCLLVARPRWTGALVVATWAALTVALLTSPAAMTVGDLTSAAVFLGTASLIALLAHLRRHALHRSELLTRIRLEREQERTRALLGRLERLSHEDPLTGLANRRRWDAELSAACSTARERGTGVAVVLLDLDHFKCVNDRHGHGGGDDALRQVAGMLRRSVRSGDLVARLGGDELAVLMPGADLLCAVRLAEGLRLGAGQLRPEGFTPGEITLSLGVAAAAGGPAFPMELMSRADAQLYRAKITRNAVGAPSVDLPAPGHLSPSAFVPGPR